MNKYLIIALLILSGCSEEEYCENRYIDHYETVTYGDVTYTNPIYECGDE